MSELSPGPASQIGGRETASLYGTCLVLTQCYGKERDERMERRELDRNSKNEKNNWDIHSFGEESQCKSSSGSCMCMCVYRAVVPAICPDVAGVSVLWPSCKQNVKKTLCLED